MEELHQWMLTTSGGKEETTKATTKEAKAKASTGAKDSTKAIKEATTKEDTTRAKEKATQDPKDLNK